MSPIASTYSNGIRDTWHSEFSRAVGIAWNLCTKTWQSRYARSALGPFWLLLSPIAMVLLYWSVFGLALGVEWPQQPGGKAIGYIVPFMAGFAVFAYLSDVVTSSLNVFVSRRNYVRKSPLPLWVLWLSNFMAASVVGAINLGLLLIMTLAYGLFTVSGALWAIPVILLIVVCFAAVSLLLALIGPFSGDLANGIPIVMRVLFYSAPISYPLSVLPPRAQTYLWINPLTSLVELLRETLVLGVAFSPTAFFSMALLTSFILLAARWLYGRVAEAVRDVV